MIHATPSPVASIASRYPNLLNAVQFVGHLSTKESVLVIWAAKNRITTPVGSSKVKQFSTPAYLVSQAYRYRNA